ncbi:uncharacterized protein LOC131996939 [Stomoxys calcitrans]|uniref:uncharacterized protein LOC131996939 n=1 Tax=Stomoxys calcitrans TaxID=35570 RepID=UPI0027E2B86C|nr:uncharacterized protein LOC131996939 [Stomoxys calcitrans]
MGCSKVNCKSSTSGDSMVSCWLCLDSYHDKCVELSVRTADNLRENKGLRWCCIKCRAYDAEFYSFFKTTRIEFNKISLELNSVLEKFNKYKQVFDNSSRLDQFLQSPSDSLRKRKKPSDITVRTAANDETNVISVPKINLPDTFSTSVSSSKPTDANKLTAEVIPSGTNQFYSPLTSPKSPNAPNTPASPNLRVVVPKKTIFAARFAAETSENDIISYINSKIGSNHEIKL